MGKGKIAVLHAQVIACPKVQNQVFKKHVGKKAQRSFLGAERAMRKLDIK